MLLYLLAAVGAVTVGLVVWRLLHANDPVPTDRFMAPPERDAGPEAPPQNRVIGPDDDPEFLRSLDKYRKD